MSLQLKLIISAALLLIGSNLFTYAHTQFHTTAGVLRAAEKRVMTVLKKEGMDTKLFPEGRVGGTEFGDALLMAGGRYYGYNEVTGTKYLGVMLMAVGLLLPAYNPKHQWQGMPVASTLVAALVAALALFAVWRAIVITWR